MGCENSKTVRVQPVGPASVSRDNTRMVEGKEGATQTPEPKHRQLKQIGRGSSRRSVMEEFDLDEQGNKVKKSARSTSSSANKKQRRARSANTKDLMGSCESLEDSRSMDSDRGFSASSKQSADSGLGEDYSHVITEFSEEDKIKQVESAFRPRDDLELAITGVPVGTKNSAKDRARLEEAQIMRSLREEGLISKPEVQASGGMCFEIVDASGDAGAPRPPPRLEKLALERSRKKKRAQTEEEIRDKLERAERRRKKKEQERLDKLREMERVDALAALENYAQYKKSKEETLAQRMDQAQDNKERKQRELKEKQERRRKHAEEVRKRKALAKENGSSENPDDTEMTPRSEDSSRKSPLLVAESKSGKRSGSRGSLRESRE